MNMMKKAAFTFGETEMTSWPIMRAAIRVAVTLPRLNPANLTGPTVKPIARARKIASSGSERNVVTNQSTTWGLPITPQQHMRSAHRSSST
jgi:hypothetical protein